MMVQWRQVQRKRQALLASWRCAGQHAEIRQPGTAHRGLLGWGVAHAAYRDKPSRDQPESANFNQAEPVIASRPLHHAP